MNYRHIYHAGNFADVFKHSVLLLLLQQLYKKEKPVLYLDTHAGIGLYDLESDIAQKTCEHKTGISTIYNSCHPDENGDPATIKLYLHIVQSYNATDTLRYYPGSPCIVRKLLRPQDKMILTELHKEDILTLKQEFYRDPQVAVHHSDGYQALKAFLPPKQGRGLILIDPPFEETTEFARIVANLRLALERFPIGIYMVWYPIKNISQIERFQGDLRELDCKNVILTTLAIDSTIKSQSETTGLTNCGLAIINAPWQFEAELSSLVSWLRNKMVSRSL
jgi:23S rRNA (adenine2030-N6)-methyltransferase